MDARSASSELYRYNSLPGEDSIRVIKLWPADSNDDYLSCEVIEVRLTDEPAYEAICYTWDDPVSSQTLLTPFGYLKITKKSSSGAEKVPLPRWRAVPVGRCCQH